MGYLFFFHMFPGVRQRKHYGLDMLITDWWLTDLLKLNDHTGHMPHMLPHGVCMIHIIGNKLDDERRQLSSHIDTKTIL